MNADHLEIPFRLVRAIFVYLTEIKQIISNILDKLAGQVSFLLFSLRENGIIKISPLVFSFLPLLFLRRLI